MIYDTRGLGDAQSQAQITNISASIASAAAPIGLAIAGATSAIPFVGPAIAGITLLIGLFTKRGAQKEASTHIVDQVEPYLKQNLQAWNSSSKTISEQQQSLANFDTLWQQVVSQCSNGNLGDPGRWCIEDRQRGGKWDWFAMYRDPIANDPNVQTASIGSSVFGGSTGVGGSSSLVIFGGLAIIAYLMMGGKESAKEG